MKRRGLEGGKGSVGADVEGGGNILGGGACIAKRSGWGSGSIDGGGTSSEEGSSVEAIWAEGGVLGGCPRRRG